MKQMKLKECKQRLVRWAKTSDMEGYGGDALNTMFKFYVLELVERVAIAIEEKKKEQVVVVFKKKKRKPSTYNLFASEQLKKGLNFSQIAELWKTTKKQKKVEDGR